MTIPDRMMAIDGSSFGGPEVLRLVELPEPEITGEHDDRQ